MLLSLTGHRCYQDAEYSASAPRVVLHEICPELEMDEKVVQELVGLLPVHSRFPLAQVRKLSWSLEQ